MGKYSHFIHQECTLYFTLCIPSAFSIFPDFYFYVLYITKVQIKKMQNRFQQFQHLGSPISLTILRIASSIKHKKQNKTTSTATRKTPYTTYCHHMVTQTPKLREVYANIYVFYFFALYLVLFQARNYLLLPSFFTSQSQVSCVIPISKCSAPFIPFYSSYKDMASGLQITKSLFMYLFLHGMH